MDSDDWIDPAYCERLYEAAREAEADIACASMLKIRPSYSKWTIHCTERQVAAEAQEKFRLCRCPPDFYVMNKLLRREMLLRLGLRFRERVCYEDVEYTMRLLGEGGVLVTVPDVVYRYVVNGASITKSRQTPKKQQDKYLAHKAFRGLRRRPRNTSRREVPAHYPPFVRPLGTYVAENQGVRRPGDLPVVRSDSGVAETCNR